MASVAITRLAGEDLDHLIETRDLSDTARARVRRSLLTLEEFPRAGKTLSGVWRDCRALLGPWSWLIVIYTYAEDEDKVGVLSFHDGRTSSAAAGSI